MKIFYSFLFYSILTDHFVGELISTGNSTIAAIAAIPAVRSIAQQAAHLVAHRRVHGGHVALRLIHPHHSHRVVAAHAHLVGHATHISHVAAAHASHVHAVAHVGIIHAVAHASHIIHVAWHVHVAAAHVHHAAHASHVAATSHASHVTAAHASIHGHAVVPAAHVLLLPHATAHHRSIGRHALRPRLGGGQRRHVRGGARRQRRHDTAALLLLHPGLHLLHHGWRHVSPHLLLLLLLLGAHHAVLVALVGLPSLPVPVATVRLPAGAATIFKKYNLGIAFKIYKQFPFVKQKRHFLI